MSIKSTSSWTAIMTVALLATGLAACATPAPQPSPTRSSNVGTIVDPEEPVDPHAIGDELEGYLLQAGQITALLPGSSDVGPVSNVVMGIGESEGAIGDPLDCSPFVYSDWQASIGSRMVTWAMEGANFRGRMVAEERASTEVAKRLMDDVVAATSACGSYHYSVDVPEPVLTYTPLAVTDADGIRVAVGTITPDEVTEWVSNTLQVDAQVDNVSVMIIAPLSDPAKVDGNAIEVAVRERLVEGRAAVEQAVRGEATSPSAAGVSMTDPGEWISDMDRVGPITLGMTEQEVRDALPDVKLTSNGDKQYPRLDVEGLGYLLTVGLDATSGKVTTIEVGDRTVPENPPQTDAPTIFGSTLGTAKKAIMTALPGGTERNLIAPGINSYSLTDRAGRVVTMYFSMAESDPAQPFMSYVVEDATARKVWDVAALKAM